MLRLALPTALAVEGRPTDPVVVEDLYFRKALVLGQGEAVRLHVGFDTEERLVSIHGRLHGTDEPWTLHATGVSSGATWIGRAARRRKPGRPARWLSRTLCSRGTLSEAPRRRAGLRDHVPGHRGLVARSRRGCRRDRAPAFARDGSRSLSPSSGAARRELPGAARGGPRRRKTTFEHWVETSSFPSQISRVTFYRAARLADLVSWADSRI